MNILFLFTGDFGNVNDHAIYTDYIRKFSEKGHKMYVACPIERRMGLPTELSEEESINILRIRTGNITKTNLIEKGISTLTIERFFLRAIKKYFRDVKFDLLMYATPPITFANVVHYVKKRDGAKSYLLLKDIFPQNALDTGLLQEHGVKSLIYRYFRKKEQKFYSLSDYIGCMSQANVDYLLAHNPEISKENVHINPNSLAVRPMITDTVSKEALKEEFGLPLDKKIFIYGGNLGIPQGIPFIIDCLKANALRTDCFFVVCGTGTEYRKLEEYYLTEKPQNVLLIHGLERERFFRLVAACDIGLLFLDYRFTIPNYPSRILSYMEAGLPVLTCTDPNTDIRTLVTEEHFGWACDSNDVSAFSKLVDTACSSDLQEMGKHARECFLERFTVDNAYDIAMEKILTPSEIS